MSYSVFDPVEGCRTVARADIERAYAAGSCRLFHSRGDGKTLTDLRLDGADIDMRGQCVSMWGETWTTIPTSIAQCLNAAKD